MRKPLFLTGSLHLAQELPLLFGEIAGELDLIGNDEVAEGAIASVVALATQAHFRAGLRFGLNFHLDLLAVGERQDDLATQQGRIEVDGDGGTHLTRTGASRRATAKALEATEAPTLLAFAPEETLEEIAEAPCAATTEAGEIEAAKGIAAAGATTAEAIELLSLFPLLTILVVLLTLLWITNHIICLLQRLELSLRLRIVGMQIGMKLLGAFQVSLLHILLRYRLVDA